MHTEGLPPPRYDAAPRWFADMEKGNPQGKHTVGLRAIKLREKKKNHSSYSIFNAAKRLNLGTAKRDVLVNIIQKLHIKCKGLKI